MNRNLIIYLLTFVFLIRFVYAADHYLTDCNDQWTYGDTYFLTTDIVPDKLICMDINTSNVILDCQGYSINGNIGAVGILLDEVSDVTIKNCTLYGLQSGLELMSSSENTFINIIADYNELEGIKKDENSHDDNFYCVRACKNSQEDPDAYYDIIDIGINNIFTFAICDKDYPSDICVATCRTCPPNSNCAEGEICKNGFCFAECEEDENGKPPEIPEFTTIGIILALLIIIVGIFLIIRKRK